MLEVKQVDETKYIQVRLWASDLAYHGAFKLELIHQNSIALKYMRSSQMSI